MNAPILIFGIGFLACYGANHFFPPVHQWFWIPLFLFWLIGTVTLKRAFNTSDSDDSESAGTDKFYFALVAAPFIVALSVTINGSFDSSQPLSLVGSVTSRSSGRGGNTILIDTDQGRRDVPVNGECYHSIRVGQKVTVLQRAGVLGVSWMQGIAECRAGADRPAQ